MEDVKNKFIHDEESEQEEFLLEKVIDFREKILVSLARIEVSLSNHIASNDAFIKESTRDRAQMKECITKIPEIEKGLNNHLKSHDTFRKYIMYPIAVMILAGFGALIWQVIVHVLPRVP